MQNNKRIRQRRWCFTLNNYDDDDVMFWYCLEPKVVFGIIGEEVSPSTGTRHLQGFVHFKKPLYESTVRKFFNMRAHWELADKPDLAQYRYCSKDGTFHCIGKLDEKGGKSDTVEDRQEEHADMYEEAKSLAIEGQVDLIPGELYIKHYSNIRRIAQDHPQSPNNIDGTLPNIWIYGRPGVGKSRFARFLTGNKHYDKNCNKWWDGYQNQGDVLIDDLDKNHKVLSHHLKLWADRYRFTGESKGSSMCIRPDRIIITSNYSIPAIWDDDEVVATALERRFTMINIDHAVDPEEFQELARKLELTVVEESERNKEFDEFDEFMDEMDKELVGLALKQESESAKEGLEEDGFQTPTRPATPYESFPLERSVKIHPRKPVEIIDLTGEDEDDDDSTEPLEESEEM